MLNPKNDRLDYGRILTPPDGAVLDFAVGTTYSLDLDALVGISIALGLSEETDSELMNNPVWLLEALQRIGDKVALFCEGVQIAMPGKVTPLYILLEKMVFSVKTEKRKGTTAYPSFHPKFWLVRYKREDGECIYRVIVLSRNLTFDRSWDVAYCMDGTVTGKYTRKASKHNAPLCDFLRYLRAWLPSDEKGGEKAKRIRSLIRELPAVLFEPVEKEFEDFEFIPNGIKRSGGGTYCFDKTDLFDSTFHEVVIMSPFLSADIMRSFNERNENSQIRNAEYTLLTRNMSLAKLKPEDVSNFDIFTLKDNVIDGETAISEEAENVRKQDIHAKVYMTRKGSESDLYIGSMNASHNAVFGNVEFMIRLKSKNRYLNTDKLKAALFCNGDDNPFEPVDFDTAIEDKAEDKMDDLNAVIKSIDRSDHYAVVRKEAENIYSVRVRFGECDTGNYKVLIRPLLSRKTADFGENVFFEDLTMDQLSEFYIVTVSAGKNTVERVLIIPTKGLPKNRENAVISKIVNDEDCFYRYIASLLEDDPMMSALELNAHEGERAAMLNHTDDYRPALYEKMLQTAATAPDKIKDMEYRLRYFSKDGGIPDDFKSLFDTVKKAVDLDD